MRNRLPRGTTAHGNRQSWTLCEPRPTRPLLPSCRRGAASPPSITLPPFALSNRLMRQWTGRVYGIPLDQVVGSSGKLQFELSGGEPVLMKLPQVSVIDDGPGKPVNIQIHIGQRPIFAFGNSDGDLQMLQWTAR